MKNRCTDKSIGANIHPYELDLLSEDEAIQFENHLMHCEYCVSQIVKFSPSLDILSNDAEISAIIHKLAQKAENKKVEETGLSSFLSSLKTIIFKPAILIIFIFIISAIAVNTYLYDNPEPISTQQLLLFPDRSATKDVNHLKRDVDVEVVFVYEGSQLDKCYTISITNERNLVIYHNISFCGFDSSDVGKITLNSTLLDSGKYVLEIVDPEGDIYNNTQEYRFTTLLN